jgi:hypothetical protein
MLQPARPPRARPAGVAAARAALLAALVLVACTRSGHTSVTIRPDVSACTLYLSRDSVWPVIWPEVFRFQMRNGDSIAFGLYDRWMDFIGGLGIRSLEEPDDPSWYEAEVTIYYSQNSNSWRYEEDSRHILVIFRRP